MSDQLKITFKSIVKTAAAASSRYRAAASCIISLVVLIISLFISSLFYELGPNIDQFLKYVYYAPLCYLGIYSISNYVHSIEHQILSKTLRSEGDIVRLLILIGGAVGIIVCEYLKSRGELNQINMSWLMVLALFACTGVYLWSVWVLGKAEVNTKDHFQRQIDANDQQQKLTNAIEGSNE